jgi:hypothetical protein
MKTILQICLTNCRRRIRRFCASLKRVHIVIPYGNNTPEISI